MAKIYDTLLGEYIKNPGKKGLSLDDLAEKYFDYKMISYEEVTSKQNRNFRDVSLDVASVYSGEDVYMTHKLFLQQQDMLQNPVLQDIEIPLVEVLCDMESTWVLVDKNKLSEIGEILEKEILQEQSHIYALAGEEFNIQSPKQVGMILFEKLWLPSGKKTKTGYSVDTEVLEELSISYPIAQHISRYRQYSKLLSTYIHGLSEIISPVTWRIHTNYNQTIAATGRLSSTNPNLQNIPASSSGLAGEIRKAFIPFERDDVILTFDYSQIEVRLLALLSWDENLIGAFVNNIDIHANTGYFLFGKDELSSDERKIAKAVNFWVIYGISPFWLSKMIHISQAEAKEYITKFFEKYPKVWEYFQNTITHCEKNGFVETYFWRKRYISGINDKNMMIKKAAEREAMNMPIQGTSADIIKIAMIRIAQYLKENNLQSKMIMQVHDELVFNVKKSELDLLIQKIPAIMESILPWSVTLKVEYGYASNWKDAK